MKLSFISSLVLGVHVLAACSMDSKYFTPTKVSSYNLPTDLIPESAREFVTFQSQGETLHGVLVKSSLPMNRATLIYFQGNDKNMENFWERLGYIYDADFNLFIFDYQGYGASTGEPSLSALKKNSEDAFAYVKSRTDINTTFLHLYGYSLGGIFAAHVLANVPEARDTIGMKLILEGTPASTETMARDALIFPVPGQFLFNQTFDVPTDLSKISKEIMTLYSKTDENIDFNLNTPLIYGQISPGNHRKIEVENSNHWEIPNNLNLSTYTAILINFID
jgi:fermentation-respiration switch protein FrsA (DUF1100 family)